MLNSIIQRWLERPRAVGNHRADVDRSWLGLEHYRAPPTLYGYMGREEERVLAWPGSGSGVCAGAVGGRLGGSGGV